MSSRLVGRGAPLWVSDAVGRVVPALEPWHWRPEAWQPPGTVVLVPAEAWVPAPALVSRT